MLVGLKVNLVNDGNYSDDNDEGEAININSNMNSYKDDGGWKN